MVQTGIARRGICDGKAHDGIGDQRCRQLLALALVQYGGRELHRAFHKFCIIRKQILNRLQD